MSTDNNPEMNQGTKPAMDDFFEHDDTFEDVLDSRRYASRAARLKREKDRRRRKVGIAVVAAIAAALALIFTVWLGYQAFFGDSNPEPKTAKKVDSKVTEKAIGDPAKKEPSKMGDGEEEPQVAVKPQINLLIVGVAEDGGRKQARGILLAKADFQSDTIQAINVPEKLYVNVPGLGLDLISQSYSEGLTQTQKTIEELLQVPIGNHLIMNYKDFEFMVNENRLQVAFEKSIATGFFAAEKKAYGQEIAAIEASRVDIIPLPVKFVSVNGEPYYQPNNDEVNRLVLAIWGIKREVKQETTRVIILNGSGLPGVGRDISQKLVANGFMVSDVKNASSFNYTKTQIVVYKEEFKDRAITVQQILGVGSVVTRLINQDVAEIAIIVGKDYKVTN